jgi:type II secretory pathway component PulJ
MLNRANLRAQRRSTLGGSGRSILLSDTSGITWRKGGFTFPKQHDPVSARGFALLKQRGPASFRGFTLAELAISIAVLVLLALLFTQLLNSAATTTTLGNKRMDADSQARQLLDRLAIDFDQMLKRSDVSYYLKTGVFGNVQDGNDQIAFFSAVPGYYPSSAWKSPLSVVSYRVNSDSTSSSYNKLQRLGKGLVWNGVAPADTPIVFLPLTISAMWPYATNQDPDAAYEVIGPDIFRFEYYYLLSSSPSVGTANQLSAGPWISTDTFVVKDVAAIVVAIAVIEPKSRVLLTTANMEKLAGTNGQTSPLVDFTTGSMQIPGQLLATWQTALDQITDMPRPAISGVRLYERYYYLNQ